MDNDDPQRQLLLLIRDYSAEKTKGERMLSDLIKRLLELQADYEAASAKLQQTKRVREAAERELRGSQAQFDRINASLLAMETRNSGLQNDIFQVGSKLQAIKNDDKSQRDDFIRAMHEFNIKLRNFNEMAFQALKKGHPNIMSNTGKLLDQMMDVQSDDALKDIENEILSMDAEMLSLEGECQKMTNDVSTVREELAKLQKKVSHSEAIVRQSERLKDLSGNQISELEKTYSSLRVELQKKYICPKCQLNNMEASEWTPEAEETTAN